MWRPANTYSKKPQMRRIVKCLLLALPKVRLALRKGINVYWFVFALFAPSTPHLVLAVLTTNHTTEGHIGLSSSPRASSLPCMSIPGLLGVCER